MDYGEIQGWLESLLPQRAPVLQDMEEYARQHDFPIIGALSGQVCYVLARMQGARRIFEMGSGYGYSTAWFARAVAENGADPIASGAASGLPSEVHHCVWDADLSAQARAHLESLGYAERVHYHVGEAIATLQDTPGLFDMILLDIQKRSYPDAIPVIEAKLRPGGVLIADNILWSGRPWQLSDHAPDTEAIRSVAQGFFQSPKWQSFVVPVRDGLLVARFGG